MWGEGGNPALLTQTPTRRVLILHLGQINITRHAPGRVRPGGVGGPSHGAGGSPGRRLGLILAPQRGRIDDARDDIVERFGHAHRRLGRRLDEKASRARCERRGLCRGHLSRVFLDRALCMSGTGRQSAGRKDDGDDGNDKKRVRGRESGG